LKAIEASVRTSPYGDIGVKIRAAVFWRVTIKITTHGFSRYHGWFYNES
jgi:hypothetical protein